jgi:hypothetical protein
VRELAVILPVIALAAVGCKGAGAAALGEAATAAAVNAAATVIEAAASAPFEGSSGGDGSSGADDPNAATRAGPQPIDVEHARATLLLTDLRGCWPKGAAHGPGYVQVTFRWNGTVAKVAVPRTRDAVGLDAACVSERLQDVIVDPFEGDPVTVRVTYDGT